MSLQLHEITLDDIRSLAAGCAVLGTGGGGAVEPSIASVTAAITKYGPVRLAQLDEIDDDELVAGMSMIGAPTVGQEVLTSSGQSSLVLEAVAQATGRRASAILAVEIGGSNGVAPIAWAARNGLPVIDGDAMGRAFPEGQMTSLSIAGLNPGIVVMADVLGNIGVLRPVSAHWAERHARALCVASGGSAMLADHVLTGAEAKSSVIRGSVSRAVQIGRAVHGSSDPLGALVDVVGASVLIEGKVTDVERRTAGGFVRGSVMITGTGSASGRILRLELQNENLVALEDGLVLASVPDLITVVDTATASAISTESLGYGQRVTVLAWPCDPVWESDRGLELAGPAVFGYDIDFEPLSTRRPALELVSGSTR